MQIVDEHTEFIGKISKITEFGIELEGEYEKLFNVGNLSKAQMIYYYCYMGGRYEISLMFIDEPPIKRNGVTWFCLKEIGTGNNGDLHWFTLNQLLICDK